MTAAGRPSAAASPLLYFGKLPSRGDFVRSPQAGGLIQVLDRWLSGGMELIATDARWKTLYDRAAPVHFAFLGSRQSRGLVGFLMASQDASGRRFPFITAAAIDNAEPLAFMARSPLALAAAWRQLEQGARRALAAADAADAAALLAEWNDGVLADAAPLPHDAAFDDFCQQHTVGSTQALLAAAGHELQLRRLVLGLGLLLQPVLASGESQLERGLLLPLPADPAQRPLLAAFWLDLMAGFLSRAPFELALFQQGGPDYSPPLLALGFEGNSPRSLHALLDPQHIADLYIDCCNSEWVEELVGDDYALHKLSSYLRQDGLSLRQAALTFKEVFLGS